MAGIGVIGAGVAGLHLGLLLRAHDVPVTIYTDRSAADLARGRLLNIVVHHHQTLERERELGVYHWDSREHGYVCHHNHVAGDPDLRFRGDLTNPARAVDYRLYLPRLMNDFEERGGRLAVGALRAADLQRLAARHDLVVVAAGRGAFGSLFPPRRDKSPYKRAQRRICAGLFRGIAPAEPAGVAITTVPGHGEIIEIPVLSAGGLVTGLLVEAVPGGELEGLAGLQYDEDPAGFDRAAADLLQRHGPLTFERLDVDDFGLTSGQDLLQASIQPVVREDWVELDDGTFALAVGDVHTVLDPVTAQGANSASYSAWTVGEAILEDVAFDRRFCEKVALRRSERILAASDWTNLMLLPDPPAHMRELIIAMERSQPVADAFADNFDRPERQWDLLATPERTAAFLERQ